MFIFLIYALQAKSLLSIPSWQVIFHPEWILAFSVPFSESLVMKFLNFNLLVKWAVVTVGNFEILTSLFKNSQKPSWTSTSLTFCNLEVGDAFKNDSISSRPLTLRFLCGGLTLKWSICCQASNLKLKQARFSTCLDFGWLPLCYLPIQYFSFQQHSSRLELNTSSFFIKFIFSFSFF